ncbi:MAG: DUF3039 domain-containing protein [Propionibacteriaceae bacterium]|jgi:hypothetical protein|nr:DUF3039 domain-containing protein [Propionibacteriaceae bacterium]
MTQVAPGSETLLLERPEVVYEDGDHDRFSHYVPKAKYLESMVNGTPVLALCGKLWIPTANPERFPVCPTCKEIYDTMKK